MFLEDAIGLQSPVNHSITYVILTRTFSVVVEIFKEHRSTVLQNDVVYFKTVREVLKYSYASFFRWFEVVRYNNVTVICLKKSRRQKIVHLA